MSILVAAFIPHQRSLGGGPRYSLRAPWCRSLLVSFDVTVTLANDRGGPVEADAASTIELSVDAGAGALRGTTSGTLPAGAARVTIDGVIYDHAEGGVRLRATANGGTAGGLSSASQPVALEFDFSTELVAFRRTIGPRQDIYLMMADGSAFLNLTDDSSVDSDPAWSPDRPPTEGEKARKPVLALTGRPDQLGATPPMTGSPGRRPPPISAVLEVCSSIRASPREGWVGTGKAATPRVADHS